MATATPPAPPRPENRSEALVRGRIAAARARIRWLDVGSAALVLAGATLAFGLGVALLDRYVGLPGLARQLALAGYLLAAGVYAFFGIARPLWRDINPYYAAKQVERTLPEAKGSITNWLDLRDESLPPAVQSAVAARAARDIQGADIQEAVGNRPLVTAGSFLGVMLVLTVVALFVWRGQFFALLGRAFLPFSLAAIPAQTHLRLVEPAGGDATVAVNYPVDVKVFVAGTIPKPGRPDALRLLMRYRPTDPAYTEVPLLFEADTRRDDRAGQVWSARVSAGRVMTGFWYKVVGGDAETAEYEVKVRARPLFTGFDVTVAPPPYTRLPEAFNRNPNVAGYKGSVVTLVADTNRAVAGGKLEVKGGPSYPGEKLADRPQSLRFRFPITADAKYAVSFASADGEPGDPATYTITAFRDDAPQVELTQPAEEVVLLPTNGTLTPEGLAGDDFGLTAMTLRMKVKGGEDLKAKPYREGESLKLEIGAFPRRLEYKDVVELEKLQTAKGEPANLKPGDEVEFWLEATDNAEPTPNTARSARTGRVRLLEPTKDEKKQQQQDKNRADQKQKKAEHDKKQDEKLKQENEARKDEEKQAADQAKADKHKAENEKKNADKNGDKGEKKGDKGEKGNKPENNPEAGKDGDKNDDQAKQDNDLAKKAEDIEKKLKGDQGKGGEKGEKAENKPAGEEPQPNPMDGGGEKNGGDKKDGEPKAEPKGDQGGEKSDPSDAKEQPKDGGAKGGEGKEGGKPEEPSDKADDKPKGGGKPDEKGGKEGDPKPQPADKKDAGDGKSDGGKDGKDGDGGKPGDPNKAGTNDAGKPSPKNGEGGKPEAGENKNKPSESKGAGKAGKPDGGEGNGEKPPAGGEQPPKAGSSKPEGDGKRGEPKEGPVPDGDAPPDAGEAKDGKGKGKPQKGEAKAGPKPEGDPKAEDASDGKDAGKPGADGKPQGNADRKPASDPKAGGTEEAKAEPKGDPGKAGDQPGKGTDAAKKPGDPAEGGPEAGDGTGDAPSKDKIRDLAKQMQQGGKAGQDAARKLDDMARKSPDARDRKAAEDALKEPAKTADAGKPGTKPGEKEPAGKPERDPAAGEPGEKPGEGPKKPGEKEPTPGGSGAGEKPGDPKPAPPEAGKPMQGDGDGSDPKPAPKGEPGAKGEPKKKPADPKAGPQPEAKPAPGEGDGRGEPDAKVAEGKPGPDRKPPEGADGSGASAPGERAGNRTNGGHTALPGSKADADAAKRAGELRLDDLKKLPKDKLKELNMTEEEYQAFLKAYEEMLARKARVVPNDAVRGGVGGPSRVNDAGVRKVNPTGDAADTLERGGPLQPPREFQPGFRNFTEKLAKPDGK